MNDLDEAMLAEMCESILDKHNFQSFENHVYNRENVDNGLYFAMYYGLLTEQYEDVLIKWASPFEEISVRLEVSVEGYVLKEHPIGKHLSTQGRSLACLKSECAIEPAAFVVHLRALIAAGVVVLYT
ncbi:hypothetical protein [Azorhizophilus paspali]|uniref:Uncharacterized protein n=1 Tax=Azorhizophilus paspali TaxID=69963 RepID=A0ABV6SKV9_AZOPA